MRSNIGGSSSLKLPIMSGLREYITIEDSDEDESPPQRRPPPMPRGFKENDDGVLEIGSSSDDDSRPTPQPSSRRSNPQPRKETPRNAKENVSISSPAIPKIMPSKAPTSLPVPPRGRQRSGQSFRESSASGSALAEFGLSTPRRASKTVFLNSSGPIVKPSPQALSRSVNQKRPSSNSNVEDDSLFPSERAGNVPRSSRRGSPQNKLRRSESINSADATPRSSSRLAVKATIFSRPVEKSPATEKSKTQNLPSTRRTPSDNEDSTYETGLESESEEEPIDPTLEDNDIPPPQDTPPRRISLRNAASQRSIPDIDPTPEDIDVPLPVDTPSKRVSRSNPASQRSIPDSIADSTGLSSPLRKRKEKPTLRVPQLSPDPRKRNESPRDAIRRNKGKEREAVKEQAKTISQLEESLRAFQQNMNDDHALTVRHLLRDAREAEAMRKQLFVDAVSPFASLGGGIQISSKDPVPRGSQAEQIRSCIPKPKGSGTQKLSDSRTLIIPKTIKSDLSRVPKYSSHTFIRRNILSADEEKLRFVPYLGDADTKESNKRRLENQLAEAYTAQSSEPIRVSEELCNLRGHLDWWLEDLDIGCTKQTLEHYVLSQEDDMDEAGLGKKARKVLSKSYGPELTNEKLLTAEKFSRAFENVFEFSLAKVLLPADRLKEMMEAVKKSPRKSLDSNPRKSLTAHLETYATLTCLICGAMECQTHGNYECPTSPIGNDSDDGADPPPDYKYEKNQMSMQPDELIRRYEKKLAPSPGLFGPGGIDKRAESCGKQCFQSVAVRNHYEFSQKQKDDLRNYLFAWEEPESRSCDLSIAMGVPCWQIYEEIEKMELDRESKSPEQSLTAKVKRPDWYDNKRKALKQGFEEMTTAHRHEMRVQISPCAHIGRPCDKDCPCVKEDVLCERMCGCLDDCPRKFTGCSCSSYGRSCVSDTCICIQLNRECGPQCISCGAIQRLDPKNKYDDRLFTTGCQNLALSRGVAKGLIMGESQLEGTGFGLYAAEPIRKGEFVSEYGGEIISTNEAERRGIVYDRKYLSFLFDLNGEVAIDAARLGNKTRFINHADNEKDGLNCEAKIMFVNGEYRIKFITLRDVKAGEELLFNYGKKFAEKHGLSKKLPKIKEGSKKGVVLDEHLDALDGIDSGKRKNARGDMRGMHDRTKAGKKMKGKARKTAPTHEPEPEPEVEDEDAEMPDVDEEDDEEDEYEEDGEPRRRPMRRRTVPKRYTR